MEKQHHLNGIQRFSKLHFENNKMENSKIKRISVTGIFVLIFCILIANINLNVQAIDVQAQSSLSLGSAGPSSPSQISIDFKKVQISKIYPDSGGTISFIIANLGGLPAEEIEISIPSSQNFHIGDTIKIGTLNPGTQQGIQTTIKAGNIVPGTYAITVIINYKKQKQTGDGRIERETVKENFYIPINVYAPPTTVLTVKDKNLFINKEQELNLEITPKTNLRDTCVELISDCLQVVGNSKIYLGNLEAYKSKGMQFTVIPIKKECNAKLNLIYKAGEYETETLNFGLKVNDVFVDFLTEIEKKEISPGDGLNLTITAKNLGNTELNNVKFYLTLPEQFVVTNEIFYETILPDEEKSLNFQIYVKSDAETKPYKGNLSVVYEISGNKYQISKYVGISVEGKILLVITNYEIKDDKVNVEIANLGTRTANSIILKLGNGYYYIDKIDSTKKRTAIFQLKDVKNTDTLTIEWTGNNNERVEIVKEISLNADVNAKSKGNNNNLLEILVVVVVIIGITGFYIYQRKKNKKE
ncbi:MAG: hypothetical protein GW779_01605 [Candidatus Altiarchaeum hamiconexum]|uniref:CARDB domain-containing protein n=2 Tax=Candidatus Altarchaeum hamiconexum TaxID=1803513 RepID=A0A8J7YZ02_9ARCH|nr:hypothetical protein [Candidatus Altarchaeum hamiconexum]OIQ06395.1 MAG: hypothetical protein AUK59_00050 [Candidatus Altarchaeum sp. CG2_30_32_3053]PIN68036.1 MAG: hypothetical protein COV98_00720 [Candidatus Altarchaeum sp. CG12_big_fil_rev_8_21_14_0_65_33_22]PIV28969.1 MAG: hypothetical protein COS36_00310 [Candidatus Altarchaeum sp. CG03_land_8_20_14_0_80_32_618]PIX49172.1 MAG: hypothetical protein COZ53_01450 [Candidatus Altarchaeum sp. CG_4_8_14_3_um_filter_33_2054]PIZ30452.1 MAG: hyp